MPMRFSSSAIHCAAASPFLVPGPRPWKASSEIALSPRGDVGGGDFGLGCGVARILGQSGKSDQRSGDCEGGRKAHEAEILGHTQNKARFLGKSAISEGSIVTGSRSGGAPAGLSLSEPCPTRHRSPAACAIEPSFQELPSSLVSRRREELRARAVQDR